MSSGISAQVLVCRSCSHHWFPGGGPVGISFESLEGVVSCRKGFVSTGWGYLFGAPGPEFLATATVHNNDSAGLCFSTSGTYPYTVRMDTTLRIDGIVKIE